jgi:hypothetical protein
MRRALKRSVLSSIIATTLIAGLWASAVGASDRDMIQTNPTSSIFPMHGKATALYDDPPLPVATPRPTPPPAPPPPPPPPPVPRVAPPPAPAIDYFSAPHTNWVMVPSVGINVAVGSYTDCNAGTPVPRGIAARDWCAPASTVYLLGHNPGVFSPLPGVQPGALVRYWDANGLATTYAVRSVTRQSINNDTEMYTPGPPHLDFQTCANADGSMLWIVIAYPI